VSLSKSVMFMRSTVLLCGAFTAVGLVGGYNQAWAQEGETEQCLLSSGPPPGSSRAEAEYCLGVSAGTSRWVKKWTLQNRTAA
jgi:hypothetical protein